MVDLNGFLRRFQSKLRLLNTFNGTPRRVDDLVKYLQDITTFSLNINKEDLFLSPGNPHPKTTRESLNLSICLPYIFSCTKKRK